MDEINRILQRSWDWLNHGIAGSSFTFGKLTLVLVLLSALIWVTGWLTRTVTDRVQARRGIDVGIAQAVGTIFRYAVVALGALVILQSAGIDLSALTVLAGALGVGLGFGLQNVASNFISGLIILFERPIKVGDRVEVGQVMGDVRRIAARATTVVTNDNIAIIVPNSDFITQRVTNWSHGTPVVRLRVPVGVSYASDPEAIRRRRLEVAGHHDGVLAEPKPDVIFAEFGDSSLNFELRVWTRDFTQGKHEPADESVEHGDSQRRKPPCGGFLVMMGQPELQWERGCGQLVHLHLRRSFDHGRQLFQHLRVAGVLVLLGAGPVLPDADPQGPLAVHHGELMIEALVLPERRDHIVVERLGEFIDLAALDLKLHIADDLHE